MNNKSIFNLEWINKGLVPKAKAYYFKTWNNIGMKGSHSNDQIEIMYIQKDKCIVEKKKESIELKKVSSF